MQPPPRLDLGNPPQPQQQYAPPPHFPPPPPPYREEPTVTVKPKSGLARLLPTMITLAAFGGLAVLAWFAYQEGKNPTSEEDVPVIKADQEPFKHAPENADSEDAPNANKEVYNSFSNDKPAVDKKAQVMPDAERPIDRSFLKQFAGTGEDDAGTAKQESVTFGDKKADAKDVTLEAKPLPLAKANEALPTPNTGGVEVVKKIEAAKEEHPVEKHSDEAALQKAVENLKPDDEEDATPEKPAATAEKQVVKKATVEKAKPAVKAPAAKKPAAAAKATGLRVQLGAYRSDAEATREWKKAVAKHKKQLAGLKMMVQKVEIEGKGTMFRLQAGPVKSKDAAKVLCKELVAAGQGCFIAK